MDGCFEMSCVIALLIPRIRGYNRTLPRPTNQKFLFGIPPLFRISSKTAAIVTLVCLLSGNAIAQESDLTVEFRRDVLPILSEKCFSCHGFDAESRQADLRLDTWAGAIGEDGGGAVVPGEPDESELVSRIASDDPDVRMPPPDSGAALTGSQVEVLRNWIAQGAEYQKHWSFEPPQAVSPPEIPGVDHPIDCFVQSRLSKAGLQPSQPATHETLLRRVSLDLTGLPPTVNEIDAFLLEAGRNFDEAYLKVVDRLLQSPHYGERWGRWWLDQARYADSNGYSIDAPRQIWKFRDWVVNALNEDMPFDQFTIEQLAGDLLPDATQEQKIATGFHRNTQINQEGGIDKEQFRVDSIFDRVATTGTVWLGLTVGCAQCHDHKFDPISQKEYYQLFAFFNNQDEPILNVYSDVAESESVKQELQQVAQQLDAHIAAHAASFEEWESRLTDDEKQKMPKSDRRILEIDPPQRTAIQKRRLFGIEVGKIDSEYQALLERHAKLDGALKGVATTLVMQERKEPRKSTVLIKGDFTRPSEEVLPDTLSVLHPLSTAAEYPNRLDLARWMTSPDNPLTARVIVNRIWQVYFGRGLVETENDFGTLGSLPTHPQLLDWLAHELLNRDWSLKDLHRLIVTSRTYQQASDGRDDLDRVDPNNYLLGRQQRLRLEAEIIRDVCLSVSGLLSPKLGGPPVYPPIPEGVMNRGQVKRSWKVSEGDDRYRRGIYTFVYRATPPPSLNVFDAPDGFSTCTRRSRSNTPLQALTLLNDRAFVEFATALENQIEEFGLRAAFRRCTGREPSDDELLVLEQIDRASAARVLLNLDETMTRE